MPEFLSPDPDDYGVTKPVIYWRDQISVLTRSPDGPIEFGGPLPERSPGGIEVLHAVLTIPTAKVPLFAGLGAEVLPFVFPFRHDGGSIDYRISPSGCINDLAVRPPAPAQGWPYENYPEVFERVRFHCSEPVEIDEDDSIRLMHQEPWFNLDRDIILIIPSKSADPDLPNNLWNVPDDEPCVQCVFKLNTESMKVSAWTDID